MRAYISNLRRSWPVPRQEAELDRAVPEWRKWSIYADILSPRKRQAHGPADLLKRDEMLRPTGRRTDQTVYVASLSVLAWTLPDFLGVLGALASKRTALVSTSDGLTISPDAGAVEIQAAGAAFLASRREEGEGPQVGGRVSGDRREAKAKAACDRIKERWALPSKLHPTVDLLKEARVSLVTAKKHLGKRPQVQRAYQMAQVQSERNRNRRKKQ